MKCPHCGEPQPTDAIFCNKCSKPVSSQAEGSTQQHASATPVSQHEGRGGIILALGILSVVLLGPLTGIPAWVMGHRDLKEIRGGLIPQTEKGLTTAGMILGIVGSCIAAIVFFGIFIAIMISILAMSRG